MARPILPDGLWALIEPLLPPLRAYPRGGRPPVANRKALTGILFVLRTGIAWVDLPRDLDCGSGMTCWRRLRDWHRAGVWKAVQRKLLGHLHGVGLIDWSRAIVDSGSARAVFGGRTPAQIPRIAAKRASSITC